MKGLIRLSIICTVVVWLLFCGGWQKLNTMLRDFGNGKGKQAAESRGINNISKRNDAISGQIKKDDGD